MGKGQTQENVKVIAQRAFQFAASANCNHVYLYLDGLKNPLISERTQKILFQNKSEKQSGEVHA